MTPQQKQIIHEYFNIRTEKFQYTTNGWVGAELFRELVLKEYGEKVMIVNHTTENSMKITKGYL